MHTDHVKIHIHFFYDDIWKSKSIVNVLKNANAFDNNRYTTVIRHQTYESITEMSQHTRAVFKGKTNL